MQRITDDDLIIQNNPQLTSLTGLGSLTAVARGDVRIQGNPELTSLTGLEKLTRIGELFVINNAKITSIAALSSVNSIGFGVEIASNPELTSLTGLGRVGEIRNGDLFIRNNPKLINLVGLSGLRVIGGRLLISSNRDLTSLTGIDNLSEIGNVETNAGMLITENPNLTSIAALSRVGVIGGQVLIRSNGELTTLNGLERITRIGDRGDYDLEISGNARLASLAGLSSLVSVRRDVVIQGNSALTSLTGLEKLTSIGGRLTIFSNAQLSTCAIASVCRFIATPPPGGVTISGNATGCASVAEVQANCNPMTINGFSASPDAVCVGSPITFTATATNAATPYSFTLTNGSNTTTGTASTTAFSQGVVASGSGTQNFTLTVSSGGQTATASVSVTISQPPSAPTLTGVSRTLTQSNTPLPLGQFVQATGGNGLSFSSVKGAIPNPPTADISPVGVQSFSVSQTDANGCVSAATPFSLTVVPITPANQTVCRSSQVVLKASTTGVRYEWYKNGQTAPFKLTEIASIQRGTTTSSLTLVSVQTTASYYVKVFQANGSSIFEGPFVVTVNYNCVGGGARVGAPAVEVPLGVVVLGNPVTDGVLRAVVQGASGGPLQVLLTDSRGRLIGQQTLDEASADQPLSMNLGSVPGGLLLLRVSTPTQSQTVKVIVSP